LRGFEIAIVGPWLGSDACPVAGVPPCLIRHPLSLLLGHWLLFSGKQSRDCSAIEGKIYTVFGIEVIVSEVAWDYIVLLVKSL
jgi:hypothetical protein